MVPSEPSSIAQTEFEARPFAVVYVATRPPFKRLTPAFNVPTHTVPSRLRRTVYMGPSASPLARVNVSVVHDGPRKRKCVNPPRCRPIHNSPGPPAIEYTTSRPSPASVTCCRSEPLNQ